LLYRSFLSLADHLPAAPLAASLVSFTRQGLARRAARCIARFFLLPTTCPPCCSLNRSFLSLADDLPAAPLAASLVLFTRSGLPRRAARCIARFFHLPTSCPLCRSLYRLFFPLVDDLPPALLAAPLVSFTRRGLTSRRRSLYRLFLSPVNRLPAAPLAASLVAFSC
jgi:hypothetical protein